MAERTSFSRSRGARVFFFLIGVWAVAQLGLEFLNSYRLFEFGEYIDVEIVWEGKDLNEIGVDKRDGKALVKVSQDFFRPAEVDLLLSDASKAKKALGWAPETSFKDLIKMMVEYDLAK